MDELNQLLSVSDKGEVIVTILAALLFFQLIVKLFDYFKERFGISTNASRREKEQSEKINKIEEETQELKQLQESDHEEMKKFQTNIMDALDGIKKAMLDDKIERMRYEILDFGNACQKRDYSKENFDHILATYDKYEKILVENHLENGQVDLAIAYIKKRYAEYLESGFPTY